MSSLAIFISVLVYFGSRPLVAREFLKKETTPKIQVYGQADGWVRGQMGAWISGLVGW